MVSVRIADFTADVAAIGRLLPRGASDEQLVSLVSSGAAPGNQAGTGAANAAAVPATGCSGPR